jgi:hypothetical protein
LVNKIAEIRPTMVECRFEQEKDGLAHCEAQT